MCFLYRVRKNDCHPLQSKMVIVRERPVSYSDSTSFNALIKFVSTIIVLRSGL
jgi:hypothetical protein